jgi:glutamyl-Q tRNA(Asp) synthetase
MPATSSYLGRFAPSPTGDLHFGSLVAALASWLAARAAGGTWKVRIEDLDPPREVPGSAQRILAALDAFGLRADGEVWYQSRRGAVYAAALEQLRAADAVFPCWCSRSQLEPTGGLHRGPCIAAPDTSRPPAWRLRVTPADGVIGRYAQDLSREVGDFVLRRADGWTAYQLAVVVDDAAQGITEVVRGADLLESTPRQILLQRRLGLPTPAYLHVPLAIDAAGHKLSKQLASRPVDPADPLPALRAALAFLGQPVITDAALPIEKHLERAARDFDRGAIPRRLQHPAAQAPRSSVMLRRSQP